MQEFENRMVVDSEWADLEKAAKVKSEPVRKGYREFRTHNFVPEDEAYEYALDKCLNGTEEEQLDFRIMLVEWFYSGNWIKEE